ncbi:MAG: DNA-binding response regulator [Chloroflexi bacterium HGW-Chloroflexi-5]|nr:MAG: DNA-binding response regulator [Chloroflexi bacterium HGW-Chloroflexi-5]
MTIKVLLVDDHAVVRLGLNTLLSDEREIIIVGEAANADQAMKLVDLLKPDVVILDIQIPGKNGIEVCKSIVSQYPNSKVVMLTSHTSDEFITQAIRAGASGYVLKQVGNEELLRAIKAAYAGEMAFDTQSTTQMVKTYKKMEKEAEDSIFADISQRELQVMVLVAEGQSNKEIGKKLNLSEITIRNYVSNILSKLNFRNRIDIARFAIQHHLEEKVD